MSLPNYLAKIKSSGIYRFVWDKSEVAGVPAEILRLVVGYSDKGPFNTPVYIARDTEFKAIFGDISKKLEKRGIWFHRMALQCLSKGPIIALNLKKFENETVKAASFNVKDSQISLNDIKVESIYDTSRFWKLDPEAILPATGNGYISIASTDSKDTSCSVFIRGYKPTGYDVTIKEWYSSIGEEVPDYFITEDKDYSSMLVSDFFAEIYVFKGEFTPALCANEPLNQYFDIVEGIPQLKEYVENAFGEKLDTLPMLAADEASNFVNVYSGCLLPFFKNQQNAYISLDLLFNADNAVHKLMMNLNSDLLYNGDISVEDIVTIGWLSTYKEKENAEEIIDETSYALGAPLKQTKDVYSSLDDNKIIIEGELISDTYNYNYDANEEQKATAFDYDFYEYKGVVRKYDEYDENYNIEGQIDSVFDNDVIKYVGGKEYHYVKGETANILGNNVNALVFENWRNDPYLDYEKIAIYNNQIWVKSSGSEEYTLPEDNIELQDLESLIVKYDENPLPEHPDGHPDNNYTIRTINIEKTAENQPYEIQKVSLSNKSNIFSIEIDELNQNLNISILKSPEEVSSISIVQGDNQITESVSTDTQGKYLIVIPMNQLGDGKYCGLELNGEYTLFVINNPYQGDNKYYYRYAFTENSYRVYCNIIGDGEDLYVKGNKLYHKNISEGTYEEWPKHDENNPDGYYSFEIIKGSINGFDFLTSGFNLGDRIVLNKNSYDISILNRHNYFTNYYYKNNGWDGNAPYDVLATITYLTPDFIKAVDFEGNEYILSRKDSVVKCNHSCSITNYNLKPFYFEGYTYENAKPASTSDWDKLQWQKEILSTLIDYDGLRTGLTNRKDIDFRYVVDTFEAFVDEEVHKELALICKEKDNAVGFLNFPSVKTFKNCSYSSFTDEKGRFQVKYIAEGANKKKPSGVLFSLVSEPNGASFVSYNTPLLFTDGTIKNYVPAAALVSNNFMDKYAGRQPYYVVAGPTYGRLVYTGMVGPDFNYSRADLDILEPMGVNVTVYVPRLGTYINSNQTAKQTPVTALSKLNIRELCIYLQDEIEALLQSYQWEFNTPYLRDLIKAKADTICERIKNNGGIQEYLNVCDESNNTDDVLDNEMFVLSTSIEPGRACGKMIQELTIYKSGALKALIK